MDTFPVALDARGLETDVVEVGEALRGNEDVGGVEVGVAFCRPNDNADALAARLDGEDVGALEENDTLIGHPAHGDGCKFRVGLAKRPARNNPQKAEPGEKAKERAAKRAEKAAAPAEDAAA